jgi:hypothetical protein
MVRAIFLKQLSLKQMLSFFRRVRSIGAMIAILSLISPNWTPLSQGLLKQFALLKDLRCWITKRLYIKEFQRNQKASGE